MSKYTNNLNLFKHEVVEDAENNFDIDKALNENWDKIDEAYQNIITKYSLITNTGSKITLSFTNDFKVVVALLDKNNNELSTATIELPFAQGVSNVGYINSSKSLKITYIGGRETTVSISGLIEGLVTQTGLTEQLNALKNELQVKIDKKVDKENGKGLSTNDYSNEEKEKVTDAITEITNAKTSTVKGTTYSSVKERLEAIEQNIQDVEATRGHIYTIRRKISNNTSPSWERLDDNIGKVANATHNGTEVQNDFDNLSPWKDIISFNLDLETGKKKAFYGDADFAFDGSNGDVYTHFPTFWLKIWKENDYMYISVSDYAKVDYEEIKEFDIARYLLGIGDDTKPHSYSGLSGADFKSIVTYRNLVKTSLGEDYCLMDWRYFVIQCLYLVEYATFNAQTALGNGISSLRHNKQDVALIAGTNTNSFVVNTTAGNAFMVGQQVKIGQYEAASCELRTITAINNYNDGTITGKELILDEPLESITTTTTIWSCVQNAGQCDSLGMKSGCLSNDSKHNVIYRGIEGFFGNIFQFVDGINIKDRVAWVCYEPSEYVSDKFEAPYEEIGYTNSSTNGYQKALGFDINHPLIQFPTEAGGNTNAGTCDYYYQEAGNRVARVGGGLNGGAYGGPWCWNLYSASSYATWYFGARVLKHQ